MRLPSKVKVGYRTYDIAPMTQGVADATEAWGFVVHAQSQIAIYTETGKVDCANSLLHEILHCCLNVGEAGLEHDQEERAVTVTANMLIGICQTNPEVIRWIMRNARAEE